MKVSELLELANRLEQEIIMLSLSIEKDDCLICKERVSEAERHATEIHNLLSLVLDCRPSED
jgi:hypothetical protein